MSGLRMKIRKSIGYEVNPIFNEIIKQKMIDFSTGELALTGSQGEFMKEMDQSPILVKPTNHPL